MTVLGLDVSSCQGLITPAQWAAIAARGTRFAVAKAATGNDGNDPTFGRNIANARAAGLDVTGYVFPFCGLSHDPAHPGRDPLDQAQAHYDALDGVGSEDGDLAPCVDAEWPAPVDWKKWGVTAAIIRSWLLTYLGKLESLCGRTPILYTYPDFARNVGFTTDFARFPLWAAEYDVLQPVSPWSGYALLQTAGGKPSALSHRFQQPNALPGGAPVDTDVADETIYAQLLAGPA